MNNKEILVNKPEGATHFDGDYYYKCNDEANNCTGIWAVLSAHGWNKAGELKLQDVIEFRSISDIEEIEALKAENERLGKECGEFQEGFFEYMGLSDHLQIEVDNLKKRIVLLTTPDSSIKRES